MSNNSSKSINTVFVGTGAIAHTHAEAMRSLKTGTLQGVFDPNSAAMQGFAKKWNVPNTYSSLEQVLNDPKVDAVHLLTPPETHLPLLKQILDGKKPVLVEKPIIADPQQFDELMQKYAASNVICSVNQNMAYFPALAQFKELLDAGKLGKIKHLDITFHPTVKQLVARQFTHWMFARPLNLLLELAVHPLSQVFAVAKFPHELNVSVGTPLMFNSTNGMYPEMQVTLRNEEFATAFHFLVGGNCPAWTMTAYCDDATVKMDMIANTIEVTGRTKFLLPVDYAISGVSNGLTRIKQSLSGVAKYSATQLGLRPRGDGFFESFRGSITDFHQSIHTGKPGLTDARFGLELVKVCEKISQQIPEITPKLITPTELKPANSGKKVLLIGGTGFIGRYTTELLVNKGYRVKVMSRGTRNLPDIFLDPSIEIVRGDVKKSADLETAMQNVDVVVNLAHGGGGSNLAEMKVSIVDSAVMVAQAAANSKIGRVIHIGSIAGLFLGDKNETITGKTPPDPQPEKRGDYANAKALADTAFENKCKELGVESIVLRPAIVVGDGTAPLHNGVGHTNNDQHVIGWNEGNNPLPFVLVEDCATAILGAIESKTAAGKSYNLAGDVRPSAREYMIELTDSVKRPLEFHSTSIRWLYAVEIWKYVVKTLGGKKIPFPSTRDFTSRAMYSPFDCSDAKQDLNWVPNASKEEFSKKAIRIHS
jgi:2-alkyl-3-oxoalkanoate reductase